MHAIELKDEMGKEAKYAYALQMCLSVCDHETNKIANCANIVAILKEIFNWWWVGFYWVDNETELVLGPFQGPVACTRINKSKGVCGACWRLESTVVVDNVDEFDGHIACSSASKSEIVVPIFDSGAMVGLLDIDSEFLCHFDSTDKENLEQMMRDLSKYIV